MNHTIHLPKSADTSNEEEQFSFDINITYARLLICRWYISLTRPSLPILGVLIIVIYALLGLWYFALIIIAAIVVIILALTYWQYRNSLKLIDEEHIIQHYHFTVDKLEISVKNNGTIEFGKSKVKGFKIRKHGVYFYYKVYGFTVLFPPEEKERILAKLERLGWLPGDKG